MMVQIRYMPSIKLKNLCCIVKFIFNGVKVNCILWDEFAKVMTKYTQDTLESSIVLVMQLTQTKRPSNEFPSKI